jgi:PAS domain S-box-containing protein
VHERERAQAALRDSEQRFRNILNTAPIGILYTDLRGYVKQANPRFCELTGYAEDELQLMTVAQYTHPDDVEADQDLSRRLVLGELPMYRRQKRYITKDGRTLWVQSTVTLLRDELGQARRIVGVVEDITEHLRLQDAETARERAEAANRAKSEFLSRMSHELRTPLNAMLGFAQLLELDRRHPLAPDQQPWVAQIQQAGWHLLDMINDVLDLSRIESGNLKLQIEPIGLPDLLSASLAMVDTEAKRRGLDISTDLADGTGVLMGDATRVKQILVNLLSNAVKYNSEGGRIHVASRMRPHDMVEIAVTDTGLGMTAEQLAELFQPFNRLGRERSAQEGTGIGLVISQRLAELMGGSLRARSIAGEGSSFILALPCAVEPDTVPSNLDPLITSTAEYHRRIVHYVEDNETNVEVMRGILAQRPQVQMEVSMNGRDGLRAIRAQSPDLVLLDMHLPDLSGLELLARLKADPATADIPVVVVSADATAQQIDAALQAGASLYLTKPVSVSELLAVVDEVLERSQTRFG